MVKIIGLILIVSSLLALAVGAYIDWRYGSNAEITGNVVTNIITQPSINLKFFDYVAGIAFAYSIISFIMGIVFLFRM